MQTDTDTDARARVDLLSATGIRSVATQDRRTSRGVPGDVNVAMEDPDGCAGLAEAVLLLLDNPENFTNPNRPNERAELLAGVLHDLAAASRSIALEKAADYARERAKWLESEARNGGDARYLRLRAEEATYVGSCLENGLYLSPIRGAHHDDTRKEP